MPRSDPWVEPEYEVKDGDDGAELLGVAGVGVGEVGGQHDDVQHHTQNVDQKGQQDCNKVFF